MKTRTWYAVIALGVVVPLIAATADRPSRAAFEHCRWEKLADANAGLQAWVMRCSDERTKTDFVMDGQKLMMRVSGQPPHMVVEVIDLESGESAKQGLRRFFDAHTDKALASRCVIAPYDAGKPPAGVKRYTFVPDAAYGKELHAQNDPDLIPDPPCGEWGVQPDAVEYFEVHEGARRVLFVDAGQDDPLYDEKTLRILPLKGSK